MHAPPHHLKGHRLSMLFIRQQLATSTSHKTMYGIHSDLSFHIFSLHGLTILSAIIWRSLFHTFHCTCLQFRLDRQIFHWIYEQHLASNIGGLHLYPRDIQCTVGNDSVDIFFKFRVEVLQCCRGADLSKWWE